MKESVLIKMQYDLKIAQKALKALAVALHKIEQLEKKE